MKCPIESHDNAELLLAFCARKLDYETTAILQRHIEICPSCKNFYEAQRLLWDALDSWEATEVSTDFDRRLYRRIEAEPLTLWNRMGRFVSERFTHQAIPLTAAAGLVLTAGLILQNSRPTSAPASETATRIEAVTEQVERTVEDLELLRQFDSVAVVEVKKSNSM